MRTVGGLQGERWATRSHHNQENERQRRIAWIPQRAGQILARPAFSQAFGTMGVGCHGPLGSSRAVFFQGQRFPGPAIF